MRLCFVCSVCISLCQRQLEPVCKVLRCRALPNLHCYAQLDLLPERDTSVWPLL